MINILWFKRDLRVYDNEALVNAAKNGIVLPLYIFEPALWDMEEMSFSKYEFLKSSLKDLNDELKKLGQSLIIKNGNAIEIFDKLHNSHGIQSVFSHQETWNGWSYQRDTSVRRWFKSKGINWFEFNQNGVIRRLEDRNGWAKNWQSQMSVTSYKLPPKLLPIAEKTEKINAHPKEGNNIKKQILVKGGRLEGLHLLDSFLNVRGENYTKQMSSPVTAYRSCSLISSHLAFGTISMRETFQAAQNRKIEIQNYKKSERGNWPSALNSFLGRLRWHCHFIQKLEDEPRIEFENMHPSYDNLRNDKFDEEYFLAWKTGNTGYPMIDACMRSLISTGWLNFRMRAMLVSFSSYHLWLHWRRPATYLASLFVDFEPGIHFSQMQMQSGTTGINSVRIYNPTKQGQDHDPDGTFIKKWVPELTNLPPSEIHEPWKTNLAKAYPSPIIEESLARKKAAALIYNLRRTNSQHNKKSKEIANKHGSRKSGLRSRSFNKTKKEFLAKTGQLPLPL